MNNLIKNFSLRILSGLSESWREDVESELNKKERFLMGTENTNPLDVEFPEYLIGTDVYKSFF